MIILLLLYFSAHPVFQLVDFPTETLTIVMSLLRQPLTLMRRCSSLLSRGGFTGVRHCSAETTESPIEAVSESLLREAVAAVKESHVVVEDALPPINTYPEKYETDGFEYTGRANIDYADPYIHYKLEVDMEKLRLDQPSPRFQYFPIRE